MSGVYEIRQLSELLITINILQSEIRLSEEEAKVILGYMQGHDFMLVLDVGQLVWTFQKNKVQRSRIQWMRSLIWSVSGSMNS